MELDFDKEIDALLRQMPKSDADFAGKDAMNSHLDADEISAFAENALPEKAKQRYIAHLAGCDPCRKNLSELILLNAENKIETVPHKEETVIIAPAIPWYRKIFAFPNLAYTMGALVLAFTGLTAFIVLQNFKGTSSEVAQVNTNAAAPANAPFASKPMISANSNAEIAEENSFANTNMSENTAIAKTQASPEILGRDQSENKSIPATNLPLDAKSPNEKRRETDSDPAKLSDKETLADGATLSQNDKPNSVVTNKTDDVMVAESKPVEKPAPLATPKPPQQPAKKKNEIFTSRSGESVKDDAKEEEKALRSISSRQISGKTFNRKDGVWYDSAYKNQQTTNVRRGTDEYRKLDSGLRSIAENLSGVVVVVWKEKGYRIQ